jgi:large subunit ribosomal protein L3
MEFIVEKVGMSRTVGTVSTPVTLLKVIETKVCEIREDGKAIVAYSKSKKLNKAIEGQQAKYAIDKAFNKFMVIEVPAGATAGDLDTAPLGEATLVKTSLDSKGKGFQGGVKRHGFAGGRGSHGHRMGRRVGSIGNCEWPGRVMKGKKMPGQMGNEKVTVKNEVVSFDAENGILVLKGSIPGFNGARGLVRIVK